MVKAKKNSKYRAGGAIDLGSNVPEIHYSMKQSKAFHIGEGLLDGNLAFANKSFDVDILHNQNAYENQQPRETNAPLYHSHKRHKSLNYKQKAAAQNGVVHHQHNNST
jgi:hypothetical protein